MNKRYLILILFTLFFISAIVITQRKEAPVSNLKMKSGKIMSSSEWINTEKAIETLVDDLRRNPGNKEIKLKLAQAYIQEGRISGDHSYYDALAFKMVNEVLDSDDQNFEALCCKATLQASAHQFSDALTTCKSAIRINPYNAYIYGVLCDANVELGNYDEAISAADKMVSTRPDIRSYARISYLREIMGDYPGAIEAMKMALQSGVPGLEQTEWVRTYLGWLYEITGKQNLAEINYKQSLYHRENYAPAIAGLGRIEKARKNYAKSIQYFKDAGELMQDYSYHQELAKLYKLTGEVKNSDKEFQVALDMLMKHKHPTSEETGIGHNIDRELALVYLSMNVYDKALNSARAEYERRPENIDVNEVLAWSYYRNNQPQPALAHILRALKTKSRNAELWYKAGIIFKANQKEDLGNQYLALALRTNPNLDKSAFENEKINLASK